jgi:flavin-dependent dehydrogenase
VFDASLAARARRAGAQLVVGARATGVEVSNSEAVVVCGDGKRVRARASVLACGANYAIQRRVGLGAPSHHLQSAQIELPARRAGDVEIHIGRTIAPRGFAWAVPVHRSEGSFVRVGLMCDRDARQYFDRFLARIADRWEIGDCTGVAPRCKILPLAPIVKTYAARLLAVGDAAGLVKATTGGGIYYSVLSGSLAADVLADRLRRDDLGEPALAEYERRWRSQLGEELAAQLTLRELADRMSDDDIDDLFELARVDGVMPIVRRTATFNRHRHLIVSLLGHAPARSILTRGVLGWVVRRRAATI